MSPGRPSVLFCLQLNHIWGSSWTDQNTVPIVLRMLAARGMVVCGAMEPVQDDSPEVIRMTLYKRMALYKGMVLSQRMVFFKRCCEKERVASLAKNSA